MIAKLYKIHRRKKEQEKDPGHWDVFKLIRDAVKIPVIANGDIFCYEDMEKIKKMSSKNKKINK